MHGLEIVKQTPRDSVVAVVKQFDDPFAVGINCAGELAGFFPNLSQIFRCCFGRGFVADVKIDVVGDPLARLGIENLDLDVEQERVWDGDVMVANQVAKNGQRSACL